MSDSSHRSQLARLIADVLAGDEVVISKAGTPLVRLVPVASMGGPRSLGLLAGQITESDDCWAPDPETDALFCEGALKPAPA